MINHLYGERKYPPSENDSIYTPMIPLPCNNPPGVDQTDHPKQHPPLEYTQSNTGWRSTRMLHLPCLVTGAVG